MKCNFEIVDISEADSGDANERWYRYEIANTITRVSGRRRGSREEVTAFVQACIQRLNSRHLAAVAYYGR